MADGTGRVYRRDEQPAGSVAYKYDGRRLRHLPGVSRPVQASRHEGQYSYERASGDEDDPRPEACAGHGAERATGWRIAAVLGNAVLAETEEEHRDRARQEEPTQRCGEGSNDQAASRKGVRREQRVHGEPHQQPGPRSPTARHEEPRRRDGTGIPVQPQQVRHHDLNGIQNQQINSHDSKGNCPSHFAKPLMAAEVIVKGQLRLSQLGRLRERHFPVVTLRPHQQRHRSPIEAAEQVPELQVPASG